jgi:hypothetical protein
MTDKTIIPDMDKFADETMRLHFAARPDLDATLDLDKRTDETVVANGAAVKVGGLGDLNVGSKQHIDNADGAQGRAHCRNSR